MNSKLKSEKKHEVVETLMEMGLKSWSDFLMIDSENLLELKRREKSKLIDVSKVRTNLSRYL